MSFLWQLLPGAREARNQLIVGYAWVLAIGLWTGVPDISQHTKLHELVQAAGAVGVGVALSCACFLIGSLSEDLIRESLRIRGARTLTRFSGAPPVLTVRRMEEWGVRSELERLEASIDRSHAEVLLRFGLIAPVLIASAAGLVARWSYGACGLAVLLALAAQGLTRRADLRADLSASHELRLSVAAQLEAEPETQAARAAEERLAAEQSEASRRARQQAQEERARRRAESEARLEQRLLKLEQTADKANELDTQELALLRKLRDARELEMALTQEDADALKKIAEIRMRELAAEVARNDADEH